MSKENGVGVIVGRFQVAKLHPGHLHIINMVRDRYEKVLVVVGVPKGYPTPRNPLSYEMRQMMIARTFPDVVVFPLYDHPSDDLWSKSLDALITSLYPRDQVILCGSRDSFLSFYMGKFLRQEFPPYNGMASGTEERVLATEFPEDSESFRRGVIFANSMRRARVYPTVDVAIFRPETDEVLLAGKKIDGGRLRFVGGFVDPADVSCEAAARREAYEETGGLGLDNFRAVDSSLIDDWRYRGTGDAVMTNFFIAQYIFGAPVASDDIDSLTWVPIADVMEKLIPSHQVLGQMLLKNLKEGGRGK